MEIVEVKCANCRKKLYIQENYVRKEMFCTPRCMDLSMIKKSSVKLRKQTFPKRCGA